LAFRVGRRPLGAEPRNWRETLRKIIASTQLTSTASRRHPLLHSMPTNGNDYEAETIFRIANKMLACRLGALA